MGGAKRNMGGGPDAGEESCPALMSLCRGVCGGVAVAAAPVLSCFAERVDHPPRPSPPPASCLCALHVERCPLAGDRRLRVRAQSKRE